MYPTKSESKPTVTTTVHRNNTAAAGIRNNSGQGQQKCDKIGKKDKGEHGERRGTKSRVREEQKGGISLSFFFFFFCLHSTQ